MATILPILRSVLTFLYISGHTEKNVSAAVMNGFVQRTSVASYISKKDQAVVFNQIAQESRRTKAIILLAIKLGLRDCDICNLTFQEIDWHNDKIRLHQKKTGNLLVLPLLPDVGNALMEYILYERPKRGDKYPFIFLRKQAPYNKIASAYQTCSNLLMKLGIKPVNGSATGVHVFRYTMVHRLLAAKTPHQVITDILGHVSKESDKPYLCMDDSMLRLCALDLSAVGKVSWEGGV
jgi:integrase